MALNGTLILIDRSSLHFFSGGVASILNFPNTVIRDLEIIDKETYRKLIGEFLSANQISVGEVAILLAESVCFVSEVVAKNKNSEKILNEFILNMPFEDPIARFIENKIVGVDKGVYDTLVTLIGSMGGKIKMVTPIFLSKEMFGIKTLDENVANFFKANEELFVSSTFAYEAVLPTKSGNPQKPQKVNKRVIILISVFVVLILILIWLLTQR